MYSTMSSEQEMLRDSVRRFMKSEVAPHVAQHDRDKTFPFELLKELSQFGYIGGRLPEALGGMDMDQMTWAMLMEEAGYTWLSLRTMVNITNAAVAVRVFPKGRILVLQALRCHRRLMSLCRATISRMSRCA